MAELVLKSSRFRAEREADWRRLEKLLAKVEKGTAGALSEDELIALPVLYRGALSSLSAARATSLDRALVDYLENLSTRAYFVVYGTRASAWERVGRFFSQDWPAAAKALWRETLVSGALMLTGAVVAFMLTARDPDWFEAFVPHGLAEGRTPGAATAALRATLFGPQHGGDGLSVMASFLFTHNSGIAFLAVALGFAFCLPTAMLEFANGCTLGAFLSVFIGHGLGVDAGGWLMIHGVTELLATVLAGAAGFRIGCAVAFPGGRARLDAAAEEGRRAAVLMAGVIVMLFCAGLLEGFARQLIQDTAVRYGVAVTTGVLWLGYLYLPRREAGPEPEPGP